MKQIRIKTVWNILAGMVTVITFTACGGGAIDYSLIPVSPNGDRWGFIDRNGDYIITPQFGDADFFSDGLALIKAGNGKVGYINEEGEYVIAATYKDGTMFNGGLAFVVSDGGFPTCIDKNGETKFVLNSAKYVSAFSEGLALFVTENDDYGFVDPTGTIVINAQFQQARSFSEGYSRIKQENGFGLIDKTGKITVNPQFAEIGILSEGRASFNDGRQWGYIDTDGSYVINPQYEYAGRFSEGLAPIKQGNTYGYIDRDGNTVINPQFDNASHFSDGMAAVQLNQKYGYVNQDGKYEINTMFEYAGDFHDGVALVRSADKWGFIDKEGKYVVNPQYQHVKFRVTAETRSKLLENDYYDASEFIRLFFERDAGNKFDSISASTTLEELSAHPKYGAGVNASAQNVANYRQPIPITKDISINGMEFLFNTRPLFTPSRYGREYDFTATPDAIVYHFALSGRAGNRQSTVINAMRVEIERRCGQAMSSVPGGREGEYTLIREGGQFDYYLETDGSSSVVLAVVLGDHPLP